MIRLITCLALALVLALTSQSMAVARGSAAATGQIVLCTGAGPVAIYVDAEGQPTHAPHICPDSALNVLFEVAKPVLRSPMRVVAFEVVPAYLPSPPTPARIDVPPSRGPPGVDRNQT